MTRALSVYLDLLRFLAAVAVFGGHLVTNPRWIGEATLPTQIQNQ
jgi:hypothetical protein